MLKPGFRIRGEIGILTEYIVRSFKLLQLDQIAILTNINMQGIKGLHLL
jgi:hypothetical protein